MELCEMIAISGTSNVNLDWVEEDMDDEDR
jgi:hypothetical protein